MELKTLRLKPRDIQAIQYTDTNYAEIKEWVQSNLAFQNVVATAEKLYLPTVNGVDILVPGDWILYDPEDNLFRGAEDNAIQNHYEEV